MERTIGKLPCKPILHLLSAGLAPVEAAIAGLHCRRLPLNYDPIGASPMEIRCEWQKVGSCSIVIPSGRARWKSGGRLPGLCSRSIVIPSGINPAEIDGKIDDRVWSRFYKAI